MNSNPYAVPAIVACAVILIGCITGLYWVSTAQRPAGGRHARPHHGKHEAADTGDSDGARFAEQLKGDGRLPYCWDEDEIDAGWWRQEAPADAVEILTGPGTKIAATSQLVTTVLARVQDAVPGSPDDPCDTGEFAALLARGRVTPAQEADRLASKYLAAPQ